MIWQLRVKLWFWRRFLRYWLLSQTNTIILISGMPRSGTTVLYNITKLLLKQSGKHVEGAWVNDLPFRFRQGKYLVIKLHDFDGLLYRTAGYIIHSQRDIREIAASQTARDGVEPDLKGLKQALGWDKHWEKHAHICLQYQELEDMPKVVRNLASMLDVSAFDADEILEGVSTARSKDRGAGLWHANHLTGKGQRWEEVLSEKLKKELETLI